MSQEEKQEADKDRTPELDPEAFLKQLMGPRTRRWDLEQLVKKTRRRHPWRP